MINRRLGAEAIDDRLRATLPNGAPEQIQSFANESEATCWIKN